jgi:flavin reductase (DIM6/NTAB) family NADH-FMN oxidoreductase RutF
MSNIKKIDPTAMFKFSYGLYLVSTKSKGQENACIADACIQLCENPTRIALSLQKSSYTSQLIQISQIFNLSVLTLDAPYALFDRFGLHHGNEFNKFQGFTDFARSSNGLIYLTKYTNAVLSVQVESISEAGDHLLIVGVITESWSVNDQPSITYDYFRQVTRLQKEPVKPGYVCQVCGYVYPGTGKVPDDYICPMCGADAENFVSQS